MNRYSHYCVRQLTGWERISTSVHSHGKKHGNKSYNGKNLSREDPYKQKNSAWSADQGLKDTRYGWHALLTQLFRDKSITDGSTSSNHSSSLWSTHTVSHVKEMWSRLEQHNGRLEWNGWICHKAWQSHNEVWPFLILTSENVITANLKEIILTSSKIVSYGTVGFYAFTMI